MHLPPTALTYEGLTERHLADLPRWVKGTYSPDYSRDANTRSLLATLDGAPVGVIAWWTPRVHHSHYHLALEVHPDHRRQGIATALYQHARAQAELKIPMMVRDYLGEPLLAFADSLGAETLQIVPPSTLATVGGGLLRTSPQVAPATGVSLEDFADAYIAFYEWTHEDWAPVSGDHRQPLARTAQEAYNELSSVALSEDGRILALLAVFEDDGQAEVCGETTRRNTPQGEFLMEACLARSLGQLRQRGIETVEADGHISDPHLFPAWVKLQPQGRWFRLAEIPVG